MNHMETALHSARVIAACALGGTVLFGLALGWVPALIPALAAVDMHLVGLVTGALGGVVATARERA